MSKSTRILAWVILAVLGLGMVRDWAIQSALAAGASEILGTRVTVGSFRLWLLRGKAEVKDLRVYQPAGFEKGVLLRVSELSARCDVPALLTGRVHLNAVTVKVPEVIVINDNGKLNADSLKIAHASASSGQAPAAKQPSRGFRVDDLNLAVGRIVRKDYETGKKPRIEVYEFNMEPREFHDISSPEQLAGLVLAQSLQQAAVKGALIYGAAAVTGIGLIPVGAAFLLTSKSDVTGELRASTGKVYDASLKAAGELGEVITADKKGQEITAKVDGCDTVIRIYKAKNGAGVNVSAKKLFLPQPRVAAGVLYLIEQDL